jgi:hypothetical protein
LKQEIFPSRGILKNGESVEKNKRVKREIFTGGKPPNLWEVK